MTNDAPGMKGYRSRNQNGELRQKRGDTHVSTLEDKYNKDFNVRSDMHLETLLNKENVGSLDQLLRKQK
jgi:hypothetical protein